MIHGNGFPDREDYWIYVGRAVEAIENNKRAINLLVSLADGYPGHGKLGRWNRWGKPRREAWSLLSSHALITQFLNGQYQINKSGIDVLYELCKLRRAKNGSVKMT